MQKYGVEMTGCCLAGRNVNDVRVKGAEMAATKDARRAVFPPCHRGLWGGFIVVARHTTQGKIP